MTLGLKAYVARTIKEAAKDYTGDRKERLSGAVRDAAHGTNTGWWNDLIYTADCIRMANRYRRDIGRIVVDMAPDQEEGFAASVGGAGRASRPGELPTLGEIAVATRARITFDDYDGTNGLAAERHAEALLAGLRLSVELLVWELASEWGVYA